MKLGTLMTLTAIAVALPLSGCRVEQTQEGKLPDVEVEVSGGQLPKFDVDAPQVSVDTETVTVKVPDVDVRMEEKTVEVPDVDVTFPGEAGYRDKDGKRSDGR